MDNSMDTTQAQERPTPESFKTSMKDQSLKHISKLKKQKAPPKEVELQYRIFSYTSQEEDGKAENLLLGTDFDGNVGWHSKRFCEFPQELIIYFNSPVKLTKLVVLSHQNKISSQIDLYSYFPSFENEVSASKYKRLGKFSLDDNSKSNYQARESKSVYLDSECQYLKFVFSQCHVNKYNIFNQVALQSIKCHGYIIKRNKRKSVVEPNLEYNNFSQAPKLDRNKSSNQILKFYNERSMDSRMNALPEPRSAKINDNRESSFIGLFFDDKLKSLKKQEEKAMYEDDYDQLKKVRIVMQSILKAQSKLEHLTQQKGEAIKNEDYETAQMIKNEMNKIQKTIMSTNDRNASGNVRGRGATLSPIEYRNKGIRKINNSMRENEAPEDSYGSSVQNQKALNPLAIKTLNMKKESLPKIENDIFAPKRIIGAEERTLPALGRGPVDFNKVNEDEYEYQKPEQTNSAKITLKVDKKLAQHLDKVTGILGEDLAKKVCADKWYFQQEGLQAVISDLGSTLQPKTEADRLYIIGFLADIC